MGELLLLTHYTASCPVAAREKDPSLKPSRVLHSNTAGTGRCLLSGLEHPRCMLLYRSHILLNLEGAVYTKGHLSTAARQTPGMRVIVAVVQRLQALSALAAGQLVRVCALEEARRQLNEPLWVNGTYLHVTFRCGQP